MLKPFWFRPAWRQILLGGADLRSYHHQMLLLDLFQTPERYISGLSRGLLYLRANRIPEPASLDAPFEVPAAEPSAHRLVAFRGVADNFSRLNSFHALVRREYCESIKAKWLRLSGMVPPLAIGMNIRRCKDFHDPHSKEDFRTQGALRTPLDWFVETLRVVRKVLGRNTPAILVSDGTAQDLKVVLAEEGVTFLRPGCAASDLLALANCSVLIGSGGSTFSAWASYLGQMPTVTIMGQTLKWFGLESDNGAYIGDFDPEQPHPEFLQQLNAIAASRTARL